MASANVLIRKLWKFSRDFALPCTLALGAVPAHALNADGPLRDMLVDATLGEFGNGEARTVLGRLNQFDLSAYSFTFSDGSRVALNQDSHALDQTLRAYEEQGLDPVRLAGPNGQLEFGDQDVTCATGGQSVTPDFESNAVGITEQCLGIRTFQQSTDAVMAATLAEVNTIDLLIARPTSRFMVDIRRFATPRRAARRGSAEAGENGEGGGSGDDGYTLFEGPWGIYFNGGGNFGNIDSSSPHQIGFGIDSQYGTGGFDYRFSDTVVAGFMFNFAGSQARFAKGVGSLDADMYRFLPFISLTPFDNAYIDILAGYGYHTYNSRRNATGTQASANYSADQALAAINLGYTHSIGALSLTGYAGGSYIGTNVNGFNEQGRGTLLKVGGYSVSSWTSTLGTELAYAHGVSFGVLKPHLRLEWVHEFANDRNNVNVVVPAQGIVVNLTRTRMVQDWGRIAAGVQALLPHGLTGFVNYEAQVFAGGESHLVEGGLRMEF